MPQLPAAAIYSLQYMYITERIAVFQFPAHNTSPHGAKARVGNVHVEAKLRYSSDCGCSTLNRIPFSPLSLAACPYLPARSICKSHSQLAPVLLGSSRCAYLDA